VPSARGFWFGSLLSRLSILNFEKKIPELELESTFEQEPKIGEGV
jgi:hypothetical protein